MPGKAELKEWVAEYCAAHKCQFCDGTGSTGKGSGNYTCDHCDATGLEFGWRERMPTFRDFFRSIKGVGDPDAVKRITLDYLHKVCISYVIWGRLADDRLDAIMRDF